MNMLDCGTNECRYLLVSASVLTLKNHVEVIEVMLVVIVVVSHFCQMFFVNSSAFCSVLFKTVCNKDVILLLT